MNVFGFDTLDAIMGLLQIFLWSILIGHIFGLVRYILFGISFKKRPVMRQGKEVNL